MDPECIHYNWMIKANDYWVLSPSFSMTMYVSYFNINSLRIFTTPSYSSYDVYPSVYLKPDVRFISGTGSENDPYNLAL